MPTETTADFKVLETVTSCAPLGLRFWDVVLDRQITGDLQVMAYSPSKPDRRVCAQTNRSGVYVFHKLPGLRVSQTAGDNTASPPQTMPYVVTVSDPVGRYSPVAFTVQAPHRGLLMLDTLVSPATALKGLLLFSTPARRVPNWLATVRVRLFDETTGNPAANAVVRLAATSASGGVTRYYGISDDKGEVLVMMPYPTTYAPYHASPAGAGGVDLQLSSREVSIEVLYAPGGLEVYEETGLPDYLSLLTQSAASIRPRNGDALLPQLTAELEFNKPLVLQTDGDNEGRLWVRP